MHTCTQLRYRAALWDKMEHKLNIRLRLQTYCWQFWKCELFKFTLLPPIGGIGISMCDFIPVSSIEMLSQSGRYSVKTDRLRWFYSVSKKKKRKKGLLCLCFRPFQRQCLKRHLFIVGRDIPTHVHPTFTLSLPPSLAVTADLFSVFV